MSAYCDINDVLAYLPKLRENSSADVSTSAIQSLIDMQASKIRAVAKRRNYTLPTPTTNPVTNQELLLYLLNVELPVAEIILRRSGNIDPFLRRPAMTQKQIAEENFLSFINGKFWSVFNFILPTTPLATAQQANAYAPGFPISPTTTPSESIVQLWCNAESALIYAWIKFLNYKISPYSSLTTDQQLMYRRFVAEKIGSYIVRMRGTQFTAINEQANLLLENNRKERIEFTNRYYDETLRA